MAAAMSFRRVAVSAAGVGVAAGCLGTWFEMSHGVVCMPVLTLPPLALSQHVAIGSTLFGVAVRQALSAGLYGLEPDVDLTDWDRFSELIDVNAATVLASTGTVAALAAAALCARVPAKPLRKANGLFLAGISIFIQWRETRVQNLQKKKEDAEKAAPLMSVPASPVDPLARRQVMANSDNDYQRLAFLGAVSGAVIGFFGIGPAWILGPVLVATNPTTGDDGGQSAASLADSLGSSASDEWTRRTCCFAMVPPSLAAAWRHFRVGHVTNASGVALPLAAGAIFGSVVGGQQLMDVPNEDFRYGLSLLLFANGAWLFFKS